MKEKVALKTDGSRSVRRRDLFLLKRMLRDLFSDLQGGSQADRKNIPLEYKDRGDYRVDFTLGMITSFFRLHTNVFTFEGVTKYGRHPMCATMRARSFVRKIPVLIISSRSR